LERNSLGNICSPYCISEWFLYMVYVHWASFKEVKLFLWGVRAFKAHNVGTYTGMDEYLFWKVLQYFFCQISCIEVTKAYYYSRKRILIPMFSWNKIQNFENLFKSNTDYHLQCGKVKQQSFLFLKPQKYKLNKCKSHGLTKYNKRQRKSSIYLEI
jgi:hypothetical protein